MCASLISDFIQSLIPVLKASVLFYEAAVMDIPDLALRADF